MAGDLDDGTGAALTTKTPDTQLEYPGFFMFFQVMV